MHVNKTFLFCKPTNLFIITFVFVIEEMNFRMKQFYIFLLIGSGFILSCKKEPTTWNTLWEAPVMHGSLTLNDMLPNYSSQNTDGYASLIFNDTAFSFKIDTLIKLPDTTLLQKTAIAFSSVTLSPGSFIDNNNIDQLYDLGEVALKRVIIREGQAFIVISSPWPGKTKAVFEFPKVKDNFGNVFERTYFLEPGSIADPFVIKDTFDIADFDFDLTGASGGLANNLTANISMFSNEETESFVITNLDTVILSLSFSGLKPKYARGYFGQYTLTDTTAIVFPQLKKISGQLELDSLRMNLNIQNGFDLIAQAKISELYGKNTITTQSIALTFPFLGQFLNINPATGGLYDYQPSDYYLSINSNNSTIIPFLENLPDSLVFGYDVRINPDGNISGGTDQFFPKSSLSLLADAELPLNIKMNDFTIADTLEIDASGLTENLEGAKLTIRYVNSFPLTAFVPLYLLDGNNVLLDSIMPTSNFLAGKYNASSFTTEAQDGTIVYPIDEGSASNLRLAKKMIVSATFDTEALNAVKINMTDSISFKVSSGFNLKINL